MYRIHNCKIILCYLLAKNVYNKVFVKSISLKIFSVYIVFFRDVRENSESNML